MEQEKLDEAKKFLQEDNVKFEQLANDNEREAKKAGAAVTKKSEEKKALMKEIADLEAEEIQKDTQIKKYEDDLVIYKEHKKFLDILAIQANRKPYQPRQKGEERQECMEDDLRKQGKQAQGADTFMTQVRQGGSPGKQ